MEPKDKILIVDDEPSIRKYLLAILEADGCDVDAVSSGKEAISKITNGERPDCIILDVLIPEIGGLETLLELMHLDRGLNVIIRGATPSVIGNYPGHPQMYDERVGQGSVSLERKLQRQLNRPRIIGGRDSTKVARTKIAADATVQSIPDPLRMVPNIEELCAKLEIGVTVTA